MRKVVYLANPYSSKLEDPDKAALQRINRRNFESYVAGTLRKKHEVAFILPIANSGAMADVCNFGSGFEEWDQDDYAFISKADEVWVLMSSGWKESIGVQAEIKFAQGISKPVKYINPITLEITNG